MSKTDLAGNTSMTLSEAMNNLINLLGELDPETMSLADFRELPAEKVQVFFNVLFSAGFYPKEVLLGLSSFSVTVIGQDERIDTSSTEWFADIFVTYSMWHLTMSDKDLQEAFLESMPLKPIRLTSGGALLEERVSHFLDKHKRKHVRDCDSLPLSTSCVGVHRYCGGLIYRSHGDSAFGDALLCRICGLRVCFPRRSEIYGDLREYLLSELTAESQSGGVRLRALFMTED
mgnify:CR=1 FL=1